MRHFALLCIIALTTANLSGCLGAEGPEKVLIKGVVKLEAQPLEKGDILFLPSDGQGAAASFKVENGTFEGQCEPGLKKVQIHSYRDIPGKFDETIPGQKMPIQEQILPPQYNSQSTLTAEIPGTGKNDLDFELKAK